MPIEKKWRVVVLSSLFIVLLVVVVMHLTTSICYKKSFIEHVIRISESDRLEFYDFDTDSLLWSVQNDDFVFLCKNSSTELELSSDGEVLVDGNVECVDRQRVVQLLVSMVESGLFFVSSESIRYKHALLLKDTLKPSGFGNEVQISLEVNGKLLYCELFPNFSAYYGVNSLVEDAAVLIEAYDALNDMGEDGKNGVWERNLRL